jgi:hypothetical protein
MTWVVLAFNALMLVWLIAGVGGAASQADCASEPTKALREACEAGTGLGAAIGAGIIIALWAFGDVILGVIWLVTGRSAKKVQA